MDSACQSDHNVRNIAVNKYYELNCPNFLDGVAWDWVNQKLYWTTSGSSGENSTIEVMDINTKQRKLLDTYNDGTQARGIVVDPLNG